MKKRSKKRSNKMEKVKIKRVKRLHKKPTVKEKILGGLGIASGLAGLGGNVAQSSKPVIVSTLKDDIKTGQIRKAVSDIFGPPVARADEGEEMVDVPAPQDAPAEEAALPEEIVETAVDQEQADAGALDQTPAEQQSPEATQTEPQTEAVIQAAPVDKPQELIGPLDEQVSAEQTVQSSQAAPEVEVLSAGSSDGSSIEEKPAVPSQSGEAALQSQPTQGDENQNILPKDEQEDMIPAAAQDTSVQAPLADPDSTSPQETQTQHTFYKYNNNDTVYDETGHAYANQDEFFAAGGAADFNDVEIKRRPADNQPVDEVDENAPPAPNPSAVAQPAVNLTQAATTILGEQAMTAGYLPVASFFEQHNLPLGGILSLVQPKSEIDTSNIKLDKAIIDTDAIYNLPNVTGEYTATLKIYEDLGDGKRGAEIGQLYLPINGEVPTGSFYIRIIPPGQSYQLAADWDLNAEEGKGVVRLSRLNGDVPGAETVLEWHGTETRVMTDGQLTATYKLASEREGLHTLRYDSQGNLTGISSSYLKNSADLNQAYNFRVADTDNFSTPTILDIFQYGSQEQKQEAYGGTLTIEQIQEAYTKKFGGLSIEIPLEVSALNDGYQLGHWDVSGRNLIFNSQGELQFISPVQPLNVVELFDLNNPGHSRPYYELVDQNGGFKIFDPGTGVVSEAPPSATVFADRARVEPVTIPVPGELPLNLNPVMTTHRIPNSSYSAVSFADGSAGLMLKTGGLPQLVLITDPGEPVPIYVKSTAPTAESVRETVLFIDEQGNLSARYYDYNPSTASKTVAANLRELNAGPVAVSGEASSLTRTVAFADPLEEQLHIVEFNSEFGRVLSEQTSDIAARLSSGNMLVAQYESGHTALFTPDVKLLAGPDEPQIIFAQQDLNVDPRSVVFFDPTTNTLQVKRYSPDLIEVDDSGKAAAASPVGRGALPLGDPEHPTGWVWYVNGVVNIYDAQGHLAGAVRPGEEGFSFTSYEPQTTEEAPPAVETAPEVLGGLTPFDILEKQRQNQQAQQPGTKPNVTVNIGPPTGAGTAQNPTLPGTSSSPQGSP